MNDIETLSMKDVMVVLHNGWDITGAYCFYHERGIDITDYGCDGDAIKDIYTKITNSPSEKFYIFDIENWLIEGFEKEMFFQFKYGHDVDITQFMEFVEKHHLVPTVIEKRN